MSTTTPQRVLAVVTSRDQFHDRGERTGLWLGELTHFYDVLTEAGHHVDVVSIEGGVVPLDPESLGSLVLELGDTDERYADRVFMDLLADTRAVADVNAADYDAVFLAGGHGAMYDFPTNRDLAGLVHEMDVAGKFIAAVCHGPAGLLGAAGTDGRPLVEGRKVTGFSWREEKLAGRDEAVPFRLDEELTKSGAKYTKAVRPMASKVVVDGNLVTGQNPASAKGVGEEVVKLLAKRARDRS